MFKLHIGLSTDAVLRNLIDNSWRLPGSNATGMAGVEHDRTGSGLL